MTSQPLSPGNGQTAVDDDQPAQATGNGTALPVPAGPLFPGSVDGRNGQLVIFIVLGLDEETIAEIAREAALQKEQADDATIFLTDLDRFDVFRDAGCVFEHVPSAISRSLAPDGLDWDRYLQRRLDLLQTKWRPSAMVPFGKNAQRVLNAWRNARNHLVSGGKSSTRSYTVEKSESGA